MVKIIGIIDDLVWGIPMIIFLFGTHLFLTYKTGFVQKYLFKGIKLSFEKENGKGELSVFGSLMTALSSTIGTGNIVGVATAIASGGPGAVLWTWISGILGLATKYSESYIAVKYRRKNEDGSYLGGAMTALEHLNKPLLAKIFAFFCALAAFGIGCSSQANSIAELLLNEFNISKILSAVTLCVLTSLVIFGGIKVISKICESLVPVMSLGYIVGCIVVLLINIRYLPETISLIVVSAFTPRAVAGGFIGSTIITSARYGIARGLFSNEAGMGSSPMATAASEAKNAVKPALVGSTGVFWDTIVVCLMTGLVVVSSIIASNGAIDSSLISGGSLISACFNTIPYIGKPLMIFGIMTFAYSTILGWSYYGELSVAYLFNKKAVRFYRVLWIVVIFLGCVAALDTVWTVGDILNGLMCIPNVIAVLLLSEKIKEDTRYYLDENHLDEIDENLQ